MAENGHAAFVPNGEAVVVVDRAQGSGDTDGVELSIISDSKKETLEVSAVSPGRTTSLPHNPSVEDLEKEAREKKPMWYCKLITDFPRGAFATTLSMHLMMVVVSAAIVFSGYNLFPIKFGNLPLDILDDDDYLRGLAWRERLETDDVIDRNALGHTNQSERSVVFERVELYFEEPGGNVFTKENLLRIKEVEEEFFFNTAFHSEHCQLGKSAAKECILPGSVLRYFDGSLQYLNPAFSDPTFENISGVLFAADNDPRTSDDLQEYLGKDSVITEATATSQITFSVLYVGLPLKGYSNDSDRESDQKSEVADFLEKSFQDKAKHYFKHGVGGMDFFYFSESLFEAEIILQSMLDLALSGGSLCFITLFMCLQTRSLWVSLWAILSILCSFATTNLIYRVVLDFRYFGPFHVLSIFIILGIGADNVFILFDTWKETAHYEFPSLAHRMSYVYRRAAFAMLFTSLTTAVAFIVSAFSPFLGVSTFGVFSGILVAVNYLSVIIFLPTVVVTYHLFWDNPCCCPPAKPDAKKNPIVRFFAGPYFRLVTHKVFRWIILVLFAGAIGTLVYYATKLEVNEDQIKFLKDDTNFGKYLSSMQSFRPGKADHSTRVLFVWGMKNQDIGGCHHTEVDCFGRNVWDDDFDLNKDDGAQVALMELCQKLQNLPKDKREELRIRDNKFTKVPEVQCFLEEMQVFLVDEANSGHYPNDTHFTIPVGQTAADLIMTLNVTHKDNTRIYNTSALGDGFGEYFEVVMSYWLYGGFDTLLQDKGIADQFHEYDPYLGVSRTPFTTAVKVKDYTYYYGTRLRYATIAINTTIRYFDMPYQRGLDIREAWETFLNDELTKMPKSLQGGFQISAATDDDINLWHWFKVQNKLVSTALTGIIIGVCFALPILIIATQNIVTGVLATCVIVVITVSVIALLPICGWKLGLLESLNFVLVVGLSVDYVVHLAEGYSRSVKPDRLGRLQDTLQEVGISVLSGAMTTLGASMFLLFAVILFFTQFGYFMFGTIGFSIVYSLGLFTTVMGLIGPQNDFGSLRPLFRKCCPAKKEKN